MVESCFSRNHKNNLMNQLSNSQEVAVLGRRSELNFRILGKHVSEDVIGPWILPGFEDHSAEANQIMQDTMFLWKYVVQKKQLIVHWLIIVFPNATTILRILKGIIPRPKLIYTKKNVYIKRYSTFRSSAPCQKLPIYTWDHMSKTLHSWGFPIAMLPCLITGGGIESILQWQLLQGGLKAVCQYVSVQCFFPIIPQFRKPTINSRHQLKGPQLWSIYPTAPKMVGTSLAPKRKPSTPHHPKAWNCPSHPCTGALLRPCARGVFGAVVGWWQGRVPHALYSGVISRAVGADA